MQTHRKPKVLFVGYGFDTPQGGGAEAAMLELIDETRKAGVLATGIVLRGASAAPLRPRADRPVRFLDAGLLQTLRRLPLPGRVRVWTMQLLSMFNPFATWALVRILKAESPDVLVTNTTKYISPAIWRRAKARGIRVVHLMHDYQLLCRRLSMRRNNRNCTALCPGCALAKRVKTRHAHTVDAALGVSAGVAQLHARHRAFDPGQLGHISNIVEPALCRIPASFGAPVRFGFLGRIGPAKGIETLLQAFEGMPRTGVAGLHIGGVGRGDFAARLAGRYPDPDVHWDGQVAKSEFLLRVDVLVVPSLWREPQGRVALEALRHGVPVIASDIGGLSEMAAYSDGIRLVQPGDVAALRAAMTELAESPETRAAMSRSAHDVAALCATEVVVPRFLAALGVSVDGGERPRAATTHAELGAGSAV